VPKKALDLSEGVKRNPKGYVSVFGAGNLVAYKPYENEPQNQGKLEYETTYSSHGIEE